MLEERTAAERGEGSCSRLENTSSEERDIYRRISQQSVIAFCCTRTGTAAYSCVSLAIRFNKIPFLLQWTHSKSPGSISLLLYSLCKTEVNFYESIYRSAGSLKLDLHAFISIFFLYQITSNNGLKIVSDISLWGQQSKSDISKATAISKKWQIKENEVWKVS